MIENKTILCKHPHRRSCPVAGINDGKLLFTSSFEAILMHKTMQMLTATVKVATKQVERQV